MKGRSRGSYTAASLLGSVMLMMIVASLTGGGGGMQVVVVQFEGFSSFGRRRRAIPMAIVAVGTGGVRHGGFLGLVVRVIQQNAG